LINLFEKLNTLTIKQVPWPICNFFKL